MEVVRELCLHRLEEGVGGSLKGTGRRNLLDDDWIMDFEEG